LALPGRCIYVDVRPSEPILTVASSVLLTLSPDRVEAQRPAAVKLSRHSPTSKRASGRLPRLAFVALSILSAMQARLRFRGAYARARVSFKAARFVASLLPAPRRFAVPFGQPLNAPPMRTGQGAPRSRARCMASNSKSKGHTMSKNSSNRPSHRVYAVTKEGKQSYWRVIGAAWTHSDGEGFNLQLDYLPLNDADIVIRKPKPEAETSASEEFEAAGATATA
jgi:hypothetical protein